MERTLAIVGGNWNNGSNAGLRYWNLNNASSNANLNIAGQTLTAGTTGFISSRSTLLAPWQKCAAKSMAW